MKEPLLFALSLFAFVGISISIIRNLQEIKTQQQYQMLALQQTLKLLQENEE